MKVVMIDDEKAMHLVMKRMIAKVGDIEIVGSFTDTATAFSYISNHEVNLVFVDINMPRENGMEFAQRLRENGKQTMLVFLTSHKEYALDAFDVYAFDYIVKPVEQERLHKTIQRALEDLHLERLLQAQREPVANVVAFNCLGGIDIQNSRGERVKWKSSKSAELFGYLLIHKGRFVSRIRIIEDMFGIMPQKNAESYLNTTVYQLRKALDTVGLKDYLHSDNNHYALSLNDVRVDLLSFEEGCRQMIEVDEARIEQALELEELYTGNLFGDRAYDWASNEVERLSLLYASFTYRLCVALLNRSETSTAIRLLKKLVGYNELDEQSVMLLMKALMLQKNKGALTRQYLQYADTLHKEMRIKPSPEAAALYERLLSELDS